MYGRLESSVTRRVALGLLAFLFPPACLACRRVEGIESLPMSLCSRCSAKLRPIAGPCCVVCTRPLAGTPRGGESRCLGCRGRDSALAGLLSGWSYEPPLDTVVQALKFARLEFLGRELASALHHQLREQLGEVDLVVPIPLHWIRRLRRGYNQAEAIAMPLARRTGAPLLRALRRRRPTRPQARLGREERTRNLRLAFALRGPRGRLADRTVLLVDDVVTTGATLETAARCLRQGGARAVIALTAGRTPARPQEPGKGGLAVF